MSENQAQDSSATAQQSSQVSAVSTPQSTPTQQTQPQQPCTLQQPQLQTSQQHSGPQQHQLQHQQQQQLQEQQAQQQSAQLASIPIQMTEASGNTITTMQASLGVGSLPLQIPHSSAGTITSMQTGLPLVPLQHSSAGTITTMSALQHSQQQHQQHQAMQGQQNQAVQQQQIQQLSGWGHDRVQVIQQPQLSNSGGYVQYATAAPSLMMNGNIAIQNPNGQTIQLITGGKPIQSNQLATASHMFTQGKQVITAQGQTASFPNFTQIPTSNQQTLIIGNLPNIIQPQQMTAVATSKPQDLQKYNACATNRAGVPQGAQPLFPQWQIQMPQNVWATTAPNSQPTLIAQNGSMAYTIRGPQPQDGSGQVQQTQVFVQSPPPQHIQAQHVQGIAQLQPKSVTTRQLLPSNTPGIRPGSSVSTQTTPAVQMAASMAQKTNKVRAKAYMSRGGVQMAAQKQQIMVQQQQQQQAQQQTQPQQMAQPTIAFSQTQQMIQPKPAASSPLMMSTQPPVMPVVSMPTVQPQASQQPLQQSPQITQPAIVTSVAAQIISTAAATPTVQQPASISTAPTLVESQSDKAQAVEGMLTLNNGVKTENAPASVENNKIALVKPQILTHVIDGHVILESNEPFPIVYESSITNQATSKNEKEKLKSDGNSSPAKKMKTEPDENNGKEPTKKTKRTVNYKKMNGEMKNGESLSGSQNSANGEERNVSDAKPSNPDGSKVDPTKWTVSDVYEFVKQIPDEHCNAYASNFAFQEIDGQALMLLNEKVMVKVMEMKVGPALKILAEINKMREDSSDTPEET